ncbi:DUF4142 domain-containing protein [Phenylobacterium sp.]|uniref:DUF4142 domain-containing protein n=1 Tax=Phenylobacterium sp. TaxID=1871053 RepID=UPI002F9200AD
MSIARAVPVLLAVVALGACGRPDDAQRMAAKEAATQPHKSSVTVPPPAPVPSAADFVARSSAADLFEVQSGQMGQNRAARPQVRAFAGNLVRDHTRSSQELKKAVAESGYTIQAGQAATPELQAAMSAIGSAAPGDFDRAFMEAQVKAHEQALALMQAYAQDGDVPSLKALAAEQAGAIAQHLKEARELLSSLP